MWKVLYYVGLFAAGAAGYANAQGWGMPDIIVSAAFGGGWIRDAMVLYCDLAFFASDTLLGVCFAWLGATLQALYGEKRVVRRIFALADAFGVATFIEAGFLAAQECGGGPVLAWVCSTITALGGGIISGLLVRQRLTAILSRSVAYRGSVVVAAAQYTFCMYSGRTLEEARCWAASLTGLSLMFTREFWDGLREFTMECPLLNSPPVRYAEVVTTMLLYGNLRKRLIPYRMLQVRASYQWNRCPAYHLRQPG